jgi:hypothetical protein
MDFHNPKQSALNSQPMAIEMITLEPNKQLLSCEFYYEWNEESGLKVATTSPELLALNVG